jgi:radical SAM superfamily enzyme YgiQ (UPF0313 family)
VAALLINPLAVIDGRPAHFLRDWCGGEAPGSIRYPPIELAGAAALLISRGHSAAVLDACALGLRHEQWLPELDRLRPEVVLIPSAWGSLEDDLRLAAMIRQRAPETRIALSGPRLTLRPEDALAHPAVDAVILGEIEEPLLQLVEGRFERNLARRAAGSAEGAGGVPAIERAPREPIGDLDRLPPPARELLPNRRYRNPYTRRNPFTMVWASRGCPHQCSFCQVNTFSLGTVRFRNPESVVAELARIRKELGIPQLVFKDHTFTLDPRWVAAICQGIRDQRLDISWRCFGRVDRVDQDLLRAMKAAGCEQICYGFESGDPAVLARTGKGATLEQARRAAALTRAAGIETAGSFMLGLPGDTEETMARTIRFAVELDLDYAQFLIVSPLPGTELWRQWFGDSPFQAHGYRWFKGASAHNPELDRQTLLRCLRRAYRSFYLRPRFLARQLLHCRTPAELLRRAGLGLRLLRG